MKNICSVKVRQLSSTSLEVEESSYRGHCSDNSSDDESEESFGHFDVFVGEGTTEGTFVHKKEFERIAFFPKVGADFLTEKKYYIIHPIHMI